MMRASLLKSNSSLICGDAVRAGGVGGEGGWRSRPGQVRSGRVQAWPLSEAVSEAVSGAPTLRCPALPCPPHLRGQLVYRRHQVESYLGLQVGGQGGVWVKRGGWGACTVPQAGRRYAWEERAGRLQPPSHASPLRGRRPSLVCWTGPEPWWAAHLGTAPAQRSRAGGRAGGRAMVSRRQPGHSRRIPCRYSKQDAGTAGRSSTP